MDLTGEPDGAPQKIGRGDRRHHHRPLCGDRDPGRAAHARSDRARAADRHGAARHDGRRARQPGGELFRERRHPAARRQRAHERLALCGVSETSDGWFILAVGNDAQFRRFCRVVGIDAASRDWATNAGPARAQARAVRADQARRPSGFARDDLLARLEAAGVPAGPINTVEQALTDPQVIARGMVTPRRRAIAGLRTPIRFSDATLATGRPAPQLGEDRR